VKGRMISHEFYIAANKPKKQSKKEENSKYSELQINKNQKKKSMDCKEQKKLCPFQEPNKSK
jgi:hypothetical protein